MPEFLHQDQIDEVCRSVEISLKLHLSSTPVLPERVCVHLNLETFSLT